MTPAPSADARAILLLASALVPTGGPVAAPPLVPTEWRRLRRLLAERDGMGPGELLVEGAAAPAGLPPGLAERIGDRLRGRGRLEAELERLDRQGIRPVTEADAVYPPRLREALGERAPAALFVAGEPALLARPGLAVVGSRAIDAAGAAYARSIGRACAEAELALISGGARGVDRESMDGALRAGGAVIGVLADSLELLLRSGEPRAGIEEGRLALVTLGHPGARFTVAAAMERNRIIHALSLWALVVASDAERGGTWAGARANLRGGWTPLFVREGARVPPGNRELLRRGGRPFPEEPPADGAALRELLTADGPAGAAASDVQPPLFEM